MARIDDEVEELKLAVTALKGEHKALEDRFNAHERKQNGSLDKIWAELKEMTKAISEVARTAAAPKGVPYGAATAITALVGLCSALIVYTVTH